MKCVCDKEFTGYDCSERHCHRDGEEDQDGDGCSGHGTCFNGLCSCADGWEVRTAVIAALVTVSDAAETVNALRVTATATLDGLDMDVIFERVCMTAHNMVIAITELAFAKRDTVVVIVRFLLSLNLASVPSTAYVDVSNSAPRFMRLKELDHHMSATPSAPRSVFLNVLRERCL